MKIALIGASGNVGSAILAELLQQGHQVTALARNPSKIAAHAGVTVVQADVMQPAQVAAAIAGHDAVISAYNPGWGEAQLHDLCITGYQRILQGIHSSSVKRVLAVGGAGSLFVAPGVQLVDTPNFPAEYRQPALAMRAVLKMFEAETSLQWTIISPPIALIAGPRSGAYRLGEDNLLPGEGAAPASISYADLALALVDELAAARYLQRRFTAAN